ncbi:MAG TPA: tail fiber protein [Allosphingosinicella sp.]|nr:tail fiber protein [Allosphingosinicella sp.]
MGTPILGEIKIISWNYSPKSWAFANGQFLPINQNQALFSLFGTTYGGNGQTTFAIPNLQGNVPLHFNGSFLIGQAGGQSFHTLTQSEMPAHTHFLMADAATPAANNSITPATGNSIGATVGVPSQGANFPVQIYSTSNPNGQMAPQTVTNTGGSQPHENRQPFLCLNMIVALQGVFPSRN